MDEKKKSETYRKIEGYRKQGNEKKEENKKETKRRIMNPQFQGTVFFTGFYQTFVLFEISNKEIKNGTTVEELQVEKFTTTEVECI